MKNQIKKTLAGLAVVAVIVSGASVFAAQTVTGTDNFWQQTFMDAAAFATPEDMLIQIDDVAVEDAALAELNGTGAYLGGKSGLFGKANAAFAVESAGNKITLITSENSTNNMRTASGLKSEMGLTNFAHLSFEMAVSDYSEQRIVQIQARRSGNAALMDPVAKMFVIEADTGAVKVANKDVGYTMPVGKWVRFDFIMRHGTGSEPMPYLDVYADGTLLQSDLAFDADSNSKRSRISGIETLRFEFSQGETGCYIDNLTARRILVADLAEGIEKPVITGVTLSSEKATVDNSALTISAPAGITATDFTGGDVTIVAKDGTVQESVQEDGFVIVNSKMIEDDEFTNGDIYYTLTVEGTPEPAEDAVELTVTSDSGYYADTADGADKSGVVGFKTSIEKTGDPVMQNYGTFLLKSSDFDAAAGTQTEVANAGDLESGKAYVVEVENIGEADFGTAIYAKSFVQTADGYFYSDVISNMVGANGKWLGAK